MYKSAMWSRPLRPAFVAPRSEVTGRLQTCPRTSLDGRVTPAFEKTSSATHLSRVAAVTYCVGTELDNTKCRTTKITRRKDELQMRLEELSSLRAWQELTFTRLRGEESELRQKEGRLQEECTRLSRALDETNSRSEQLKQQRHAIEEQTEALIEGLTKEWIVAAHKMRQLSKLQSPDSSHSQLEELKFAIVEANKELDAILQVVDESLAEIAHTTNTLKTVLDRR